MPTSRVVDQYEDKDAVSALMALACTSKNVETKNTNTPPPNTEVPPKQLPTTKKSPPEEFITNKIHQPHPASITKEPSNQNENNDGDGDRDNFPVEVSYLFFRKVIISFFQRIILKKSLTRCWYLQ